MSSPEPSDIEQGLLGNCWLIAALSLIAERPRLLQHILLTQHVNSEGAYLVRLCHNGIWKTIVVDDYFPCSGHNTLIFTKARRRQLFIPLIEKSCAKIFGSYSNLISGQMAEGLQLFTGAPCEYIFLNRPDEPVDSDLVWAKLLSCCQAK
jgi:calpain-15